MPRMRIGDMLIRARLIDQLQLDNALAHQRQWGGKIGDILVDQGVLDELMLWLGLSKQLDVPLVCLPEMVIAPELVQLLPIDMCERLEIFPVARNDRTLSVATSDPNNVGPLDEVVFRTGLQVKVVLAPHREVTWAIRAYYRGDPSPCPPPRTRKLPLGRTPAPGSPSATPSKPHPVGPQTPLFQLAIARASTPLANPAPSSAPRAGSLPPPVTVDTPEEQLRQANEMLRVMVELCIERGVFTREELWQKLTDDGMG